MSVAVKKKGGRPELEAERLRLNEILLALSGELAVADTHDDALKAVMELTAKELEAERASLFLNDAVTGELYSRFAQGNFRREIRFMNDSGITGHVFQTGQSVIIDDAYNDQRFNPEIDRQTGYKTRNMVCCPIRSMKGGIIGVAECLNKHDDRMFDSADIRLLEAMTRQAAAALLHTQLIERMIVAREEEAQFLNIVSNATANIDLATMLDNVMHAATRILRAERSTLFLNDEKTNQLWSQVGEGLNATQIRFPNHLGIAGQVFTTGETVNIPHAYADLRFNPAIDKETKFFTRSILCVPVVNKQGKPIGVTQVLNKRGGPFTVEDEKRLKAFAAQISADLENAKLFSDVQTMKNYNEAMLQSMSNGVITLNADGRIVTCNAAGLRILRCAPDDIIGRDGKAYFAEPNNWIYEKLQHVETTHEPENVIDRQLKCGGEMLSVNASIQPLVSSAEDKKLGAMIILEDISSEKRMKSTMARYMDPALADELLKAGGEALGGRSVEATVMFSDLRGFTTHSESLGPQGVVALLNEYFTLMVDCIAQEGGMLDKFIGDAIMAVFGLPIAHEDDEDRAVKAAIEMLSTLFVWNQRRLEDGQFSVDMGVGLHTDTIVSGNIGSPKRMDYTVIGDGVNLASRLEGACRQYGARLLISESTQKKLKGVYRLREADRVIVKGKTKPVTIYEVLDYHSDETFPNLMDCVNQFGEGVRHYRRGNWDKATSSFNEALKANGNDRLAKIYIERCAHLKANPPKDWDGVYVMESK